MGKDFQVKNFEWRKIFMTKSFKKIMGKIQMEKKVSGVGVNENFRRKIYRKRFKG
jgi:hypothetical protein